MASKRAAKNKANGNGNGHLIEPTVPAQLPFDEPRLSGELPPHSERRCTYEVFSEQAICAALTLGFEESSDPRLELDDPTILRGHRAVLLSPLRGCLVRCGDERNVLLVVEAPTVVGGHHLALTSVAIYPTKVRKKLDEPPRRSPDRVVNDPVVTARILTLLHNVPEDEATAHLSDVERFRLTTAERIEVPACGYFMASGSTSLWIKFHSVIWNVALVSGQPLRYPPPEAPRASAWGAYI